MINRIISFFLTNRLVSFLLLLVLVAWGAYTAPFNWYGDSLPSDPVAVDAIPDLGENQQIVFTKWPGRSPQDIEDQVTYPLTTYLLGIPGVKTVRSSSVFGYSNIYIIFDEEQEFYWTRSRIVEKLSALPEGLLPSGVKPTLGPDATALGQVYWYTIEGRDQKGQPTGGWDLHEIRKVQDFYVKYALTATEGVAEVASIGGYVQEFQVIADPLALQLYNLSLAQLMNAVKSSNQEVGAKTIEINKVEYLVRGVGYVKELADLEEAVVKMNGNTPIYLRDVAQVRIGPANRRGILDKEGAEVVGGVVVARYSANPLQVIEELKDKIEEITAGLPSKELADGSISKLTIVPFYDRSELIHETLGTLEEALSLEVLLTLLVVIVMIFELRASIIIASLLPIAILMVFIGMKYLGVTANIVALSGIAIAIGTMVDLGIILSENIVKHLEESENGLSLLQRIQAGVAEVSTAIITAVSTTIVSFIPVFALEGAEGKLFGPLAYTKTLALIAALIVSLLILPTVAYWIFGIKVKTKRNNLLLNGIVFLLGCFSLYKSMYFIGLITLLFALVNVLKLSVINFEKDTKLSPWPIRLLHKLLAHSTVILSVILITYLLAETWLPLGPAQSWLLNALFVALALVLVLGFFAVLQKFYDQILSWCLTHKAAFLAIPAFLMLWAVVIWMGFSTVFGFISKGTEKLGWNIQTTSVWSSLHHAFPGMGDEFMPTLNEGSFLLMPTAMPHAGISYNKEALAQLDMLVNSIPEVKQVVGKLGRVESALDPAPISMYENVINYKSEYILDQDGRRRRFEVNGEGHFLLKETSPLSGLSFDPAAYQFVSKEEILSEQQQADLFDLVQNMWEQYLIEEDNGQYFRNWRPHIQSPDDIWNEIIAVTKIPGVTSAPKLQPIETRLVMLQTGMRAPMGLKVYGPDLKTIEDFGSKLEQVLLEVPAVKSEAVFADKIIGKPYLNLDIDRKAIARYGLQISDVQQMIESGIGGMPMTYVVLERERYAVTLRYPREMRDDPEQIKKILLTTPTGAQVPLGQLVNISFKKGPQAIKSENTFLVGYVLFDKRDGYSEGEAVNAAQAAIQDQIDQGLLKVPAGVNYEFSGSYENQIRAEKRLMIIIPLVLIIVFLILYFQFKSMSTSLMVFAGIAMAFSGAFIMLWLWGQAWFMNFEFFDTSMRSLFQMKEINLSVAVWVGFIALFGIATDDGVLMATYLDQSFEARKTNNRQQLYKAVITAGEKRIRPAAMTSATTILALLPILTSTGKGAEIMIPMAIPALGGMLFAAISYFIVPVLYAVREEMKIKQNEK